MKLYKTAAAYHTWNCVLMETNRTTTPLSCCDPSEMRAPLPSDSQSLEPLWVSLSAHSYSSIDSCFSSPSGRGHNLPSSNSSRKPPHKQLNTSPEQLAAPRVGGSLPFRSAAAGRSGEAGSAPTWADAGTEPLQQPWTLLHGAPAQVLLLLHSETMGRVRPPLPSFAKSNQTEPREAADGRPCSKDLKIGLPPTSWQRGGCSKSPTIPFLPSSLLPAER